MNKKVEYIILGAASIFLIFEHFYEGIIPYGLSEYFKIYWLDFFSNIPKSITDNIVSQTSDIICLTAFIFFIIRKDILGSILSLSLILISSFKILRIFYDLNNIDFSSFEVYVWILLIISVIVLFIYYLKKRNIKYLLILLIPIFIIFLWRKFSFESIGWLARVIGYNILLIYGLIKIKNETQHKNKTH